MLFYAPASARAEAMFSALTVAEVTERYRILVFFASAARSDQIALRYPLSFCPSPRRPIGASIILMIWHTGP
jgi:hypothetical protein